MRAELGASWFRGLMASTLSEPGRYPDHRLVRKLSKTGAALDMVRRYVVRDRFTLALPLEGTSHRCRIVWRREAEMGAAFQ